MEKEKKSARNKTIDLSAEEGHAYLERCIQVNDQASLPHVLDKTILGDSFAVMPKLPAGFADLIICDPPYNLSKDFGGNRFKATSEAEYFAYTRHWIEMAERLLKDSGSMYVCCDWRSGIVIGQALAERFIIRNRITWQREKGRGAARN